MFSGIDTFALTPDLGNNQAYLNSAYIDWLISQLLITVVRACPRTCMNACQRFLTVPGHVKLWHSFISCGLFLMTRELTGRILNRATMWYKIHGSQWIINRSRAINIQVLNNGKHVNFLKFVLCIANVL